MEVAKTRSCFVFIFINENDKRLEYNESDSLLFIFHYILWQKNGSEKIYRRSTSLPITKEDPIIESTQEDDDDDEEKREKLFKKHGW